MKYRIETSNERASEGIEMIRGAGGSYNSDGSFSVSGVKGSATFSEGYLTINITDKPWLASWDMIEDKINEFFNN